MIPPLAEADGSRTGKRLGIAELWLAPGFSGPPQHLHRKHEETFFVLSGTVDFTSGHDTHRVGPGQLVTAPIGTPPTPSITPMTTRTPASCSPPPPTCTSSTSATCSASSPDPTGSTPPTSPK
ncbi:cupin domain-containing protein [Streptomyces huiliensis]|uniref:cupin domain-containing protein n=1 Tax=Streptomyces huiliensis TaxID=2876027 RepID=UPI001CBF75E4|nr:cupin domain-containing protein [Streptomyces huiliensis]